MANYYKKLEENYEEDNLNIEFDDTIKNNNFKDLLRKMLKLNPKNRISWFEYFNHPFFNNSIEEIGLKIENQKEQTPLEKSPLEFYDIILDINSIINLKEKGWNVYLSQKGKEIVESEKQHKNFVIGVLGNRNKGKSFILQAFSNVNLQTGTVIGTIGLSIKFTNEILVLLDSAGSESPLLGSHKDMNDISRDKLYTEYFIQTYIIKYSNLLLLVVGVMTLHEQKLIKKIKEELELLNKYENRKKYLFIIHNLQSFETREQIENYINEILLNSATFKLQKSFIIDSKGKRNEFYYDIDDESIKHFIFAKENSEAGNYYNSQTIDIIKMNAQICPHRYKYDYKQSIEEHFYNYARNLMNLCFNEKLELKENRNEIILEKEKKYFRDFIVEKRNLNLKYNGDIILKKYVTNELDSSYFIKNGFNLDYECYYDDKELIINTY